jgi:hypothetical protein
MSNRREQGSELMFDTPHGLSGPGGERNALRMGASPARPGPSGGEKPQMMISSLRNSYTGPGLPDRSFSTRRFAERSGPSARNPSPLRIDSRRPSRCIGGEATRRLADAARGATSEGRESPRRVVSRLRIATFREGESECYHCNGRRTSRSRERVFRLRPRAISSSHCGVPSRPRSLRAGPRPLPRREFRRSGRTPEADPGTAPLPPDR